MLVILSSLAALILIASHFIISRDLRSVEFSVNAALAEISANGFCRPTSRKLKGKLWSEDAKRINELFQLILRNFREIKVELSVERELDLQNENLKLDRTANYLPASDSITSLYGQVLSLAKNRIRAAVVAVAYFEGGKVNLHLSAREHGKFKETLLHSLKPYFEPGTKMALGVRDLSANEGVLGSLSNFGLRYAVIYPFGVDSGTQRGLIWAGYGDSILPPHTEVKLLKDLAQRLDATLSTREKISSVYQDLKKIEEVSKARDQFIAGMSHDIKTPLHNLRNILLLVQSEMQPGRETQEFIQLALRNCSLAQEMIEDILYFSRYQLGKLEPKRVRFDAVKEVSNIVESFGASAKLKNLSLRFEATERQFGVVWDRKHFERVVANLIANAIQYTQFGEIIVKVFSPQPSKVAISVLDSGSGISAENLKVVFEPYRRCATNDSEGLGLGLAIAKILTEANDSIVSASSEICRGSLFEIVTAQVLLEESNVPQQFLTPAHKAEDVADSAKLIRRELLVLVVDDDADCVNSLARALLGAGFQVLKAYSISEALGVLQFESPQLVISDAKMPHGGLKRIVAACNEMTARPGIIVLSGLDSAEDRNEFTRLGVDQILVKPAPIDTVILALDQVASKKGSEKVKEARVA